jgi:uncharacterized protein (TIGR02117 family)
MNGTVRLLAKGMRVSVTGLLALPLLYSLAALVGAVIPANPGWQPPGEGVTIFLRTNGVHTWIVVPTVNADMDWRPLAPAAHIKDPRYAGNYLAMGYGNREFYLNTPRWEDLRLRTALTAAFGRGRSLMHVEHETDPRVDEYQRPLLLTSAQYRRLARHIEASFERGPGAMTRPLLGRGYGPGDVFYEARGPYNAFLTCNEWSGAALRAAGVRTGIWTPLSQSIMLRH